MTKIFKPILEGIEKRLSEAAYNYAGQIVEKLKESTYARIRGHFNNEYGSVSMRDRFAKVKTVDKAEKQGVNPATGKPMTIPAKTVVKIVPGKALNDAANGVK